MSEGVGRRGGHVGFLVSTLFHCARVLVVDASCIMPHAYPHLPSSHSGWSIGPKSHGYVYDSLKGPVSHLIGLRFAR